MRTSRLGGRLLAVAIGFCAATTAFARGDAAENAPILPGLTPEQEETALFVLGNMLFTFYHEAGHALVSELDLPVLGREEDAVDGLAAVLMIPDEPDRFRDELIAAAADGWAMAADQRSDDEPVYWDEHGLDEQRHYAAVCLMVGSDPEGFAEYAAQTGLPEERVESCKATYTQTAASWGKLLAPHLKSEGGRKRKAGRIVVGYERDPAFEDEIRFLEDSGVIEAAAEDLAQNIALPHDLGIVFKSCGEENAFWSPEDRQIVLCYELARAFESLIAKDIASR